MGAFGELLEQHFGGTRHDVKTWGSQSKSTEHTVIEPLTEKTAKKMVLDFGGCMEGNSIIWKSVRANVPDDVQKALDYLLESCNYKMI